MKSGCYWERLRNFTGTLSGIIANDFVSGGGQQLVGIGSADAGFSTDAECGPWTSTGAQMPSDEQLRSQQRTAEIERNRDLHRQRRPRR
jgi:hypothetical protein